MWFISIFCLFSLSFSSGLVIEHELEWKESRMIEMIRNGEYSKYLEYQDRVRSKSAVVESIDDYIQNEYIGKVSVGTPGQQFKVVFDTAFANFFIPGSDCTTNCETKQKFNETLSSTYYPMNRPWTTNYNNQVSRGLLARETVKIGESEPQLFIPKSFVGMWRSLGADFQKSARDGVFGLAFTSIAVDTIIPPIINAINQGLLDQPIFTTWFARRGHDSVITFGGIDDKHCGPVIGYTPLSNAGYFQFKAFDFALGSFSSTTEYQVMTSTTTSFLIGPTAHVFSIAAAAGALYDETTRLFYLPCSADPDAIVISIHDNVYFISHKNYMIEIEDNKCIFAIAPNDYTGFGPQWILGGPFMRQYCNIHDIGRQRVGFSLNTL